MSFLQKTAKKKSSLPSVTGNSDARVENLTVRRVPQNWIKGPAILRKPWHTLTTDLIPMDYIPDFFQVQFETGFSVPHGVVLKTSVWGCLVVKSDSQKNGCFVFCYGEFNKVKSSLLGKDPFLLPMKQLIVIIILEMILMIVIHE